MYVSKKICIKATMSTTLHHHHDLFRHGHHDQPSRWQSCPLQSSPTSWLSTAMPIMSTIAITDLKAMMKNWHGVCQDHRWSTIRIQIPGQTDPLPVIIKTVVLRYPEMASAFLLGYMVQTVTWGVKHPTADPRHSRRPPDVPLHILTHRALQQAMETLSLFCRVSGAAVQQSRRVGKTCPSVC